jgi:hypothetical protein
MLQGAFIVSIRGIAAGEYVVPPHLYRDDRGKPVPVKVKVEKLNPKVELVFYGDVTLQQPGDEQTAIRFSVASDGRVRNVNRLTKALVPYRRSGSATHLQERRS